MKQNKKDIFELGKFKAKIHAALYKSDNIKELLLGDVSGKTPTELRKLFKEHVKSHLFVDEVITETESYIFYDVTLPSFSETTKMCQVQLYAVCHRDILDDYSKEGFYGNRADILTRSCKEFWNRKFRIISHWNLQWKKCLWSCSAI